MFLSWSALYSYVHTIKLYWSQHNEKGIFENKCLVFDFVMVRRTMKSAWYQQLSMVMETSSSGAI